MSYLTKSAGLNAYGKLVSNEHEGRGRYALVGAVNPDHTRNVFCNRDRRAGEIMRALVYICLALCVLFLLLAIQVASNREEQSISKWDAQVRGQSGEVYTIGFSDNHYMRWRKERNDTQTWRLCSRYQVQRRIDVVPELPILVRGDFF